MSKHLLWVAVREDSRNVHLGCYRTSVVDYGSRPASERKIVHILTHSALRRDAVEYNVTDGWHAALGRAIARHTEYEDVECWTVDYELDRTRRLQQDGIDYRVYPSTLVPGTQNEFVKPYIGQAKPGVEISLPLLRAARRVAADNAAIHLHSDTYVNTYLLAMILRDAPVFLQHHGGLRGVVPVERFAFSNLAHAFVLTRDKRRNLVSDVGLAPERVSVRTMGVDTEQFTPGDCSPADLGYETDELLVYVGKYGEYKGLDRVLDAFESLRESRDVTLAVLGGERTDPLYDRASRTAGVDVVTEYLPTDEIRDYYTAADAYVSYPVEQSIRSGDCGIIAPAEALACGTPVVSSVLQLFPESKRDNIGYLPTDPAEIEPGLTSVLTAPPDPERCHDVATEQFSWQRVAADVAAIYDDRL